MIDYLIYDLTKKFGLIGSCILKFINFLIFRDFSRTFSQFIQIYFGYLKIKKSSFCSCADVAANVAGE